MSAPIRVQLSRAKGWKMPENTVTVARPTVFGNPFSVAAFGRQQAVALYRTWLTANESAAELGYGPQDAANLEARRAKIMAGLPILRGKNLACWCAPPSHPGARDHCHADVLLDIANG